MERPLRPSLSCTIPSCLSLEKKPFPVPVLGKDDIPALSYASNVITIGSTGFSNHSGAVGDPCSMGVGALMLAKKNETLANAADVQLNYLVSTAPRFFNGAISHRANVPELWADFMYMAPPFMAYYAVDKNNFTLLNETVYQCEAYRQVLQSNISETESYYGLWEHIIGPESQDIGLWSTGNAWAAAGMARVLATVIKAPLDYDQETWRSKATADLKKWIKEIIDGAIGSPLDDGLLKNYLNATDARGFGEISGSTLLAAVAYRMAVIAPLTFGSKYIKWADVIRETISGNDAAGNPHVANGIATPAVNPLNWFDTNPFITGSPEGQNFVVLMYAAWRDCIDEGICSR